MRGIFALFGVVGWLFFPYVSYYVGLVVGFGPDFSPVGAAPGIDAYDIAGTVLWIALRLAGELAAGREAS